MKKLTGLMHIENWNRKHTLVAAFLLLALIALYVYGHKQYISPVKATAALWQEDVTPENEAVNYVELSVEDLKAVEQAIPLGEREREGDIMRDLERVVRMQGMSITSFSPVDGGEKSNVVPSIKGVIINSDAYTLQVSGGAVEQLDAFLVEMNESRRYIRIDSVRINQGEELRVDIGMTVFHRGDTSGDSQTGRERPERPERPDRSQPDESNVDKSKSDK